MTVKIISILAMFSGLCAVTIYCLIKALEKKCAENRELSNTLAKQKRDMADMIRLSEDLARIREDSDLIADEIRKAENEEEIVSIIAALVDANNARVPDDRKNGADAPAKASAGTASANPKP